MGTGNQRSRVRVDGNTYDLSEKITLEKNKKHIQELTDRIAETEKLLNESSDLSRCVVELEKEKEELMNLIRYTDAFEQESEVTWND